MKEKNHTLNFLKNALIISIGLGLLGWWAMEHLNRMHQDGTMGCTAVAADLPTPVPAPVPSPTPDKSILNVPTLNAGEIVSGAINVEDPPSYTLAQVRAFATKP